MESNGIPYTSLLDRLILSSFIYVSLLIQLLGRDHFLEKSDVLITDFFALQVIEKTFIEGISIASVMKRR